MWCDLMYLRACANLCMYGWMDGVDVRLMHALFLFSYVMYLLDGNSKQASVLASLSVCMWCLYADGIVENRKFTLISSHFIYTDSMRWRIKRFFFTLLLFSQSMCFLVKSKSVCLILLIHYTISHHGHYIYLAMCVLYIYIYCSCCSVHMNIRFYFNDNDDDDDDIALYFWANGHLLTYMLPTYHGGRHGHVRFVCPTSGHSQFDYGILFQIIRFFLNFFFYCRRRLSCDHFTGTNFVIFIRLA